MFNPISSWAIPDSFTPLLPSPSDLHRSTKVNWSIAMLSIWFCLVLLLVCCQRSTCSYSLHPSSWRMWHCCTLIWLKHYTVLRWFSQQNLIFAGQAPFGWRHGCQRACVGPQITRGDPSPSCCSGRPPQSNGRIAWTRCKHRCKDKGRMWM